MMHLPYQGNSDAVLAALVADASVIADCVALCLFTGGAYGYYGQNLALQLQDGRFLCQSWDNSSNQVSEPTFITRNLDLRGELQRLRSDGTFLRQRQSLLWHAHGASYPEEPVNHNPDLKTGMTGRFSTVYIAVGEDAEWVVYPRPSSGGHHRNTAINRILRAFLFGDSITLV